ncbi:hypothetical protein N9583_01910, partial [Burkholderiaceae bacterium]|nr:hypothetical protein [Burkholderiaceae bacterium]
MIIGIVTTPVPTTFATALPETLPNKPEARIAACAGPPRGTLHHCKRDPNHGFTSADTRQDSAENNERENGG